MFLTVAVGPVEQSIVQNPTDTSNSTNSSSLAPISPTQDASAAPLRIFQSEMSDNRLGSPRLLAIGIVIEVVNVEISDAGDCDPLLGAGILLREVDGVQRVVSISSGRGIR